MTGRRAYPELEIWQNEGVRHSRGSREMKPKNIVVLFLAWLLGACAMNGGQQPASPLEVFEQLLDTPGEYSQEDFIRWLYLSRTWVPYSRLEKDPIALSSRTETPVHKARTKVIGPSYKDSIRSLATKLWMIENAEHTLDLTYYIFKYDVTGKALLGALCNAVKRGVDIRVMVDSLGSIHWNHSGLRALQTCARNAGYIRDANGTRTTYRARAQVVIINALTNLRSWTNRRSHDKLLIKDGSFPGKDMVMTGGRNISVDYYGIDQDGSRNPDTYLDLELLLRSNETDTRSSIEATVGNISSVYYTLLFLHKGNTRIYPSVDETADDRFSSVDPYAVERERAQQALTFIKGVPSFGETYAEMPAYVERNYRLSEVRLAHQLGNLVSRNAVASIGETVSANPNSIAAVFTSAIDSARKKGLKKARFQIVSPYLFIPQYRDPQGNIVHDGAKQIIKAVDDNPGFSIEVVTNSILTSDNFHTQSIIDMDTAPRLLLTEEQQATWLSGRASSELSEEFVNSDEWKRVVNHPRIRIYQTGRLDSALIGGYRHYGKLHAKCFFVGDFGFVGTSNFDYRSRVFNNEMGFYYLDPALSADLEQVFEELKAISLRWGSEEWLEMRQKVIQKGGWKGYTTATQRGRYKFLKATGLIWLF